MRLSISTNIFFRDQDTLDELLRSEELSAQDIRRDFVSRLKRGEHLVAIVDGAPPCAIVLRVAAEPSLKGTADGETLTCLPLFA